MFKYLVACLGKKKIVEVEDKAALNEMISKKFDIQPTSSICVQAWNAEWEDYVDVEDVEDLPDSCKLNVTVESTAVIVHNQDLEGTPQYR